MDQYITGAMIKKLREDKKLTQTALAERIGVSDKTVSKWETGKGYPDITLLQPIANALHISVIELLSGSDIKNTNCASNMLRVKFYVCPICGNIIASVGEAVVSCHGIVLPPLEAETVQEEPAVEVSIVEDEYAISISHPMEKGHYISFFAGVSDEGVELIKRYPESEAFARLKISRTRKIFFYCNQDGLFEIPVKKERRVNLGGKCII